MKVQEGQLFDMTSVLRQSLPWSPDCLIAAPGALHLTDTALEVKTRAQTAVEQPSR